MGETVGYKGRDLRKGDNVRFLEDYYVSVGALGDLPRLIREGKPTRRLIASAGTVGRVIWAGKSNRRTGIGHGTYIWRIGVMLPGETKPVFINQRNYGQMEIA